MNPQKGFSIDLIKIWFNKDLAVILWKKNTGFRCKNKEYIESTNNENCISVIYNINASKEQKHATLKY